MSGNVPFPTTPGRYAPLDDDHMAGNTPTTTSVAGPSLDIAAMAARAAEQERSPTRQPSITRGSGRGNYRGGLRSLGTGRTDKSVHFAPPPAVPMRPLGTQTTTTPITQRPVQTTPRAEAPKALGPLERAAEAMFKKTMAELQAKEKVARTVAAKLDEAAKEFKNQEKELFDALRGGIQRAMEELIGGGRRPDPQPVRQQRPSPTSAPTPPMHTEAPRKVSEVVKEGVAQIGITVKAHTEGKRMDNRIFIRVQGEMAKNAPAAVRAKINQWVPDSVKDVRQVPSGFAVTARNPKANQAIMKAQEKLEAVFGGKVEKATTWHTYIYARCPTKIITKSYHDEDKVWLDLTEEVTEKKIAEEVEAMTRVKPVKTAWGKKTNADGTKTVIVTYP